MLRVKMNGEWVDFKDFNQLEQYVKIKLKTRNYQTNNMTQLLKNNHIDIMMNDELYTDVGIKVFNHLREKASWLGKVLKEFDMDPYKLAELTRIDRRKLLELMRKNTPLTEIKVGVMLGISKALGTSIEDLYNRYQL